MTTFIKFTVPDNRFFGFLLLAPIATSLSLLALTFVFLAVQPTLVLLFPSAKEGLDEAIMVLPVMQLIAGMSPIFGGLQYLLFGGVALWIYLQNNPVRPWACALLLFAVNGAVTAGIYLFVDQEFGVLCFTLGSFFAPVWGLVFALFYRRFTRQEANL
ncbi:hypothetical protein [Parasedimentitalea huanghaiensis]|uniref:Uncharacterized protein n=1 Tax=Parasedimentitalea huanghaiensis TaxID=2682100 RepID=A0A6L6WC61_9RHOB|nr:hypothetical protein [Zongyanglinia huanghaiensis]MVO15150.1 hypothetical protein [Zongyanglinia huanghaiensis]